MNELMSPEKQRERIIAILELSLDQDEENDVNPKGKKI